MRPKKIILCVDDNEQSLSIRKFMLETRGYAVVACTNGNDALAAFRDSGADLILADLMMPGLDGAELVQQIKAVSPETPAIIFSGKIRMCDKDLQADLFLPKGMHAPSELLDRIRLLLVRKRGPKKAAVSVQAAEPAEVAAVAVEAS
jgi:two-component system response regulator CpxR